MAAWSQAEFCSRRNAKRLPKDVFHVIRYESLVADPEPVLRELCAFLDEDFHPAMLEPNEVHGVVPDKKVWHPNLKQAVNTDQVESWRKGLDPWELGLMETVLRRKLKRWGYTTSGAGQRPSPKLVAKFAKERVRTSVRDAHEVGRGAPRRGPHHPAGRRAAHVASPRASGSGGLTPGA